MFNLILGSTHLEIYTGANSECKSLFDLKSGQVLFGLYLVISFGIISLPAYPDQNENKSKAIRLTDPFVFVMNQFEY